MAISIQQFRQKALSGDFSRLEVNTAGTDLHRKGLTAGGKPVEWIRDAMSLRKGENAKVMHAFVAALKTEYGDAIGSRIEDRLSRNLDGGSKPLSARHVRAVLEGADWALAKATGQNEATARAFSTPGLEGRVSGYHGAVLDAHVASGAPDHIVAQLFDDGHHKTAALRQRIAADITVAGQGGAVRVTSDDARGIAARAIETFLRTAHANDQAIDGLIGAGNPDSDVQKEVARLAAALGAPGLSGALADPAGAATVGFKARITNVLPAGHPTPPADLKLSVEHRLESLLIDLAFEGGHLARTGRLPEEPGLAEAVGKEVIARVIRSPERHPGLAGQRVAFEAMLDKEIARLAGGSQAERVAADGLLADLQRVSSKIESPALELRTLESARDGMLEAAKGQDGSDRGWALAAGFQNDIVALHLRSLGAPLTAQPPGALEALARRSPALAGAMADLDRIECAYVASKGADPGAVSLGWRESRERLGVLREAARGLVGQTDGGELQAYIAAKMRGLTAELVVKAAAVLGPPPAGFAVLSLGSASRGEASPFSDVEFAILLDRPRTPDIEAYFAELSAIVRFQVSNLGEDAGQVTPAGFHWDAGGNTPAESPRRFIGDAAQLVAGMLAEAQDNAGGSRPVAMFEMTMLLSPEHLHGTGRGADEEAGFALVKDLQAEVRQQLGRPSTAAPGLTTGEGFARWLAREASAVAGLAKAAGADVVDVKALARFPMLLAQSLALEHGITVDEGGIAANSTLLRLGALEAAGVLTPEDAGTLRDAFTLLGRVRIEAHLHAGEADDKVHLDAATANGGFAAPEVRQAIADLLPFVDRAQRHLADPTQPF